MLHELPLSVSEPVLVVIMDPLTLRPEARSVPFAAMPVIVTLPAPVDVMLAKKMR